VTERNVLLIKADLAVKSPVTDPISANAERAGVGKIVDRATRLTSL